MFMDLPPISLDEALRLFDRPAIVRRASVGRDAIEVNSKASLNEAQKARIKAVMDAGFVVGMKAGLAWQLDNINAVVISMSRDLDLVYDFRALMINQRVVPPVITEARNLYNQDSDYAVRLSGALYKIERQARFSSVPPNWREYLTFAKAKPVDAEDAWAIQSEEDRNIWRMSVKKGWGQGVEQANIMLAQAMDRLNRDFGGMSRFHRFVVEGKVSLPAIAVDDIAVTQNGDTMAVDETLLRIVDLPQFNSKLATWQAMVISDAKLRKQDSKTTVEQGDVSQGQPAATQKQKKDNE